MKKLTAEMVQKAWAEIATKEKPGKITIVGITPVGERDKVWVSADYDYKVV